MVQAFNGCQDNVHLTATPNKISNVLIVKYRPIIMGSILRPAHTLYPALLGHMPWVREVIACQVFWDMDNHLSRDSERLNLRL